MRLKTHAVSFQGLKPGDESRTTGRGYANDVMLKSYVIMPALCSIHKTMHNVRYNALLIYAGLCTSNHIEDRETHIHMYVHTYTHVRNHTLTSIHASVHVHMHTCRYIRRWTHTQHAHNARTHTCAHTQTLTSKYKRTHVYTHGN